jgi:hypothetical protein
MIGRLASHLPCVFPLGCWRPSGMGYDLWFQHAQRRFLAGASREEDGAAANRPPAAYPSLDDKGASRTYQLWDREYFYYVDMHGHLHLDESSPSSQPKRTVFNLGTSYKDKRFLDFFWKRIRRNNLSTGAKYLPKYAFVSPCGYVSRSLWWLCLSGIREGGTKYVVICTAHAWLLLSFSV